MIEIKPSFYNEFKCTADKCSDSCCVGWEIVVDEKTKNKYKSFGTDFGRKICDSLIEDEDGDICFKLDERERCPFLNSENLCDIIINCGDESLCDICSEHPRFYNEFSFCTECGLGLCCEEVCRLLLEDEAPLEFIMSDDGAEEEDDEFYRDLYEIRELIYDVLKNDCQYNNKLEKIVELVEKEYGCSIKIAGYDEILRLYKETEPINEEWTQYISLLVDNAEEYLKKEKPFDIATNGGNMYSKILAYIIFRNLSEVACYKNEGFCETLAFCIESVRFIKLCDIKTFCEKGTLTIRDRINNLKNWSKQIEYSDVNKDKLIFK
ncbi:MAG: flagellin lysine-N-methylase [Clostridia bacterium]|nr:flagellin lysine-N-methylase [Clostridia bacterium]